MESPGQESVVQVQSDKSMLDGSFDSANGWANFAQAMFEIAQIPVPGAKRPEFVPGKSWSAKQECDQCGGEMYQRAPEFKSQNRVVIVLWICKTCRASRVETSQLVG